MQFNLTKLNERTNENIIQAICVFTISKTNIKFKYCRSISYK